MLQAGVQNVASTADTVQTLAGPVVQSVSQSTSRFLGLGNSSNGAPDRATATVRWQSGRRVHLDLDPLLPFPRWHEHAAMVEEPVRKIAGVATAHVEGSLGRLVVELEDLQDNADSDRVLDEVRDVVSDVAADLAAAGPELEIRTAPFADPGNPLAILVPLTAAAFDAVAIGAAVTGWVIRLPAAPRTTRAAAALLNNQPRMVSVLESRLGRVGTDIALSASTAAANGLTQAVGTPLLNLAQRVLQISEADAYRRRWRDREPQLASPNRPQAPVVPIISSAGAKSQAPRHNWAAAAAGEASHVVVDGAIDAAIDTAKGSMAGPVEAYVDQAANGSLIAAASALVAGGGPEDAAGAVLAGIPKAAHMGRQSFAAVLGRGLADDGQLILDPGALRRLDRVKVVVIDGAALRGDHRAVLHARGDIPGWDEDRVYEVADALLHGEEAPEPDPDELPATGAALRWVRAQGPSATPAQGLEHADLVVDGETVGHVEVGWEVDPFAVPLLQIAHRTGARVVLRHVAGTQDLAASVAASHPSGTPLLKLVRDLRTDRGPVLLITALHRDFASTDTLAALAIADVGVALDDPRAATPWSADIITGTDLAAAVRILSALPAARQASESSVNLAKGGTTLAGLLLVTGDPRTSTNPLALRRWLNPVNAAAASAMVSGAFSASKVLRQPDPTPQPLTAWHALDPEIVYSRLAGRTRPLTVDPGAPPGWRRVLEDLSYSPLVSPLRGPAHQVGRLLSATRDELNDPLTPILAVGAAASAIVGSNVDALLVAGVMAVNALTGGAQRLRADAAAAELFAEQDQLARRVVVPAVATTRRRLEAARNAERTATVAASSLRPGDVIDLAAPDVVPADARLLVAEDLEVDESLLTGESLPVDKQVDAGRRRRQRPGQHAVRGQHDRRRARPGDRRRHRCGHRCAPRDFGGHRRRVGGRGAGTAARADRQGPSAHPRRRCRGDGFGAAASCVAASGGRRRRRHCGGRCSGGPAVGGHPRPARRGPAPVGARSAGPRSPHRRSAGSGRHRVFRQDRHAHRKPAARGAFRAGHDQAARSVPRRRRSAGRPRAAGRRARVHPTARAAGARARHRRGDPQRSGFDLPAKVIRSGPYSRRCRLSPAVASPRRSAH